MVWTETTRRKYRRDGLRYASATTDPEWAVLEPLLPPARRLGRPRLWDRRQIVDAILYVLAAGCQWRVLPRDFPPHSTVQGYFYRWRTDGTWDWINARLMGRARQSLSRNLAPSAGIIDSQSAPTTESGGPRGIDAGKRIKGRKRHIVTDIEGFVIASQVHAANIQDPRAAVPLLGELRRRFPKLRHIFADRVYRGPQLRAAIDHCGPRTIRDRRAPAGRQRLPAPAPAMGRRAHLRMAEPKPTPCQGLRGHHRKCNRVAAPRKHPPTLQTSRKTLIQIHSFRVRL